MALLPLTFSSAPWNRFSGQTRIGYNPIRCCKNLKETPELQTNGGISFLEKNTSLLQLKATPPPRPRRIILVRHGESEGNVDETTYSRVADPKIGLTERGKAQAEECGISIGDMIEKDGASDWQVYFYVSRYKRTLQTLQNLGKAFERSRIAGLREEPRLREQDFGNFQDREKMKVEKAIQMLYSRFFYWFPNEMV